MPSPLTPIIVVIGLAIAGCTRQEDGSQIQSLDNFTSASGKITHNICFGAYELSKKVRIIGRDKRSLNAAVGALRAIPTNVQDRFFEDYNGVINLAPPVGFSAVSCNEKSGGRLATMTRRYFGEGARVTSCLKWGPKTVNIMMMETPEVIEHNLVRTLAYFYAQQVGPRLYSNWGASLAGIAKALMIDVTASKGKQTLKPYEPLFDSEEGMLRFSEYVFAETFDSYYCNPRTKKILRKTFPRAHEAFARFNNVMRGS